MESRHIMQFNFKIAIGLDGAKYAVFSDEPTAEDFAEIFGLQTAERCCFDGFFNAIKLEADE